ncbi:hypothetical protein FNV43_RR02775 [Rhamnella rubrinervis]|uniref:Uncharacterized protein n=1 Tax=Rhamnella rubrinervis TaxID=2594499 RepID=A0A8K0HGH7_9ROSA|nr:hypothetical protein FNV43_RR02775 [Rhamnella rubrinervis]
MDVASYMSTLVVMHAILVLGLLPCSSYGGRISTSNIGGASMSSSDASSIPIYALLSRLEVVPNRAGDVSFPPSPVRNPPRLPGSTPPPPLSPI